MDTFSPSRVMGGVSPWSAGLRRAKRKCFNADGEERECDVGGADGVLGGRSFMVLRGGAEVFCWLRVGWSSSVGCSVMGVMGGWLLSCGDVAGGVSTSSFVAFLDL